MESGLKRSGFEIPGDDRGAGNMDGLKLCWGIFESGDVDGTRPMAEAVLWYR